MIPKRKEPSYEMSRHKTISVILLFIVSTMLIGILPACEGIGDDTGTPLDTSVKENTNPFYWEYTPELEPLTQEQVDACNFSFFIQTYGMTPEEYLKSAEENEKDQAKKNINSSKMIRQGYQRPYLGTFGESIVAANILGYFVETEIILGGNTIYFSSAATINVYNNGVILQIQDAYENGWLTDEDIDTIVQRVEKYYAARRNK